MKKLIYLIIQCVLVQTICATTCNNLLRELADKQSKFISCTTSHAVAVKDARFCGSCKVANDEMSSQYDLLMTTPNCSSIYKDADRMNIVINTESLLMGLWNKANCANCFMKDGLVLQNFTSLYDDLTLCLRQHTANKDACEKCHYDYVHLNGFYTDLDKEYNRHICFDIQDIMNRTRVKWSKELKCCQREVQMVAFLTSVGALAVIPVLLFYSASYVLTKRREARHGLLNETEPQLDDAPSTSTLITAAVLSTPDESTPTLQATNEKISRVLQLPNQVDSDSDDDMITVKPRTLAHA